MDLQETPGLPGLPVRQELLVRKDLRASLVQRDLLELRVQRELRERKVLKV